eukprot:gb/GECG01004193.1/.p1 GENE.gb/GECG01004193.1/~~gb/GECG01004193.1/.p1  ORF type:complete len:681 (+),score=95.94 gb/GECG01004193.1/:1-2043(+)
MGCVNSVEAKDNKAPDEPPREVMHSMSGHKHFRSQLVRNSSASWQDRYDKESELGYGMTGKVYLVRDRITGERFALKCLEANKFDSDLIGDLVNEIELLKTLDHPNVIKLYEFYYDGESMENSNNIYLVMELCEGGELFERLHAQKGKHYTEARAAHIVYMMLSAVAYCHSCGISHRDLKLENFLFESKSEDANLKLIDFGLSSKYGATFRRMHTMVGTPYYIAPEILGSSSKGYTNACDMWSVGVIAYMLLSGTPPFKGRHDNEVLSSVKRGKYTLSGRRWQHVSEDAKNFIRKCLVYNPKKRYKAHEALDDPWMTHYRDIRRRSNNSHVLDPEITSSLRAFAHFSSLKRTALQAIAFQMSANNLQKLRDVFLDMDEDKTGLLTLQEMKHALVSRAGMSEDEVETIFRDVDATNEHTISYNEFLAATLSERLYMREEYIHAAFYRLDVDHTGFISVENLNDILGDDFSPEKADQMIREADKKGDGQIDYEEFLALFRNETANLISPSKQAGRSAGVEDTAVNEFVGPAVEETDSIVLEGGPSMSSMGSLPTVSEGGTPKVNGSEVDDSDTEHASSDEVELSVPEKSDANGASSTHQPPTQTAKQSSPKNAKSGGYKPSPLRHGRKVSEFSNTKKSSESNLAAVPEKQRVPEESPEKDANGQGTRVSKEPERGPKSAVAQ